MNVTNRNIAELPAAIMVWLATAETNFLEGRMVWANWDVEELKQRSGEIVQKNLLEVGSQVGGHNIDTIL